MFELWNNWRFWILMAPQYHFLMLLLVGIVILFLVRINRQLQLIRKRLPLVDLPASAH